MKEAPTLLPLPGEEKDPDHARLAFDVRFKAEGFFPLAGVDEAGRGCLAGPVVAAAVVLPLDTPLPGVRDSKALSPKKREALCSLIKDKALDWSIGVVGWKGIDRINIYQAAAEAMRRAVKGLKLAPRLVLADGMPLKGLPIPTVSVVKGDDKSLSIAAASILAKVTRDRLMLRYHRLFPQYGFASNKGYATAQHRQALKIYGPCPIHRRSFKWVRPET